MLCNYFLKLHFSSATALEAFGPLATQEHQLNLHGWRSSGLSVSIFLHISLDGVAVLTTTPHWLPTVLSVTSLWPVFYFLLCLQSLLVSADFGSHESSGITLSLSRKTRLLRRLLPGDFSPEIAATFLKPFPVPAFKIFPLFHSFRVRDKTAVLCV